MRCPDGRSRYGMTNIMSRHVGAVSARARSRFRLRDSRSVACESGCVVRCSSSELVGVPTAPFLEAARGPQPSVPCLNLAWAAEFGDGQSFLKASFTFSPACLRLLTPCSVLPSRSICSSPLALPTCSLAAPVSYTHLRAHETDSYLVCRLLLEKKKTNYYT